MKDIDPKTIPTEFKPKSVLHRPYRLEWEDAPRYRHGPNNGQFRLYYENDPACIDSFDTLEEAKVYIRLHAQFHPKGQYRPVYFDVLGLLNNGE